MIAKLNDASIKCSQNSAVWIADDENIPSLQMLEVGQTKSLYSQGKLGCDASISNQELEYKNTKKF